MKLVSLTAGNYKSGGGKCKTGGNYKITPLTVHVDYNQSCYSWCNQEYKNVIPWTLGIVDVMP